MHHTRLILIRHGETDYNVEKKYYGFSDPPLNDIGTWQAERLYERLKTDKIDTIYSSDLKRAYHTAKIAFKNHKITVSQDLRELNFGIFEGLTHQEITKKYSKIYNNWIEKPFTATIPEGEPLKNFQKRVLKILKLIISANRGHTVAVITHGGPIKIFLNDILKKNPNEFWMMKQESAAFNIIDYLEGTPPEIITSNDISHLT